MSLTLTQVGDRSVDETGDHFELEERLLSARVDMIIAAEETPRGGPASSGAPRL